MAKPIASGFYLCCDRRAAPVLKAEANICFCPPRYGEAAAQALMEEFPSSLFQIKAGVILRQEGLVNFLKKFRSFEKAVFFAYDIDVLSNPLLLALIVVWFARRGAYFLDTQGRMKRVSYRSLLFRYFPSFLLEAVSTPIDLFKARQNVRRLKKGRKTRDYRSERGF